MPKKKAQPKPKPKLVFIDSSVYLNCALKQVDKLSLNTLKKFLTKVESKEMILLLPKIIERETLYGIQTGFKSLQNEMDKIFEPLEKSKKHAENQRKDKENKRSKITIDMLEYVIGEGKEEIEKKIEKIQKSVLKIIEEIFNHKNTKHIEITDKLILAGMHRSLFKRAPWTPKSDSYKDKTSYTKDQDCIVFEAVLEYIENNKKSKEAELVICADDGDYFMEEDDSKLHNDIVSSVDQLCKNVVGYKNPFEMLNKEFKGRFTEEQIKRYGHISPMIPENTAFINPIQEGIMNPAGTMKIADLIKSMSSEICIMCGTEFCQDLISMSSMDNDKCPKCREKINSQIAVPFLKN